MSGLTGNPFLLASAAGGAAGYTISRSLRFNSSDSAYLSRTPASAGNRTTWSFSAWVKRSKLGSMQFVFTSGEGWIASSGDAFLTGAAFGADDKLAIYWRSSYAPLAVSVGVYRDLSAWYHIGFRADGSTLKAYVNGIEVCSGAISGNGAINSTQTHSLGVSTSSTFFGYSDYYLADIHFIDGQALTPSSFTETDAITGQLIPKTYAGTYGTNGFRLTFSDNSGTSSTTLGKDAAGSNNWTPNNLSVTAGAGNDSLVDSPTNYGTDTGAGGEVRGNYCTWNPLNAENPNTLTNGNLGSAGDGGGGERFSYGTVAASSGKWYYEMTVGSGGVNSHLGTADPTGKSNFYISYQMQGNLYYEGGFVTVSWGASFTSGDVIGAALDLDNGAIYFSKNGTWQASGVPTSGASKTGAARSFTPRSLTPFHITYNTTNVDSANFGQRPFAYTAPSGFKALCTQNLPAPVIAQGSTVMDALLYTGNGSARSITGLGFNPDFVWLKGRSGATDHALYDVVRGVEKRLESNTTDAEVTSDGGVTAFNSDGFSLGTLAQVNTNAATYVAWAWDAGSSTVTNTAGSISSQVRANATAGFSIVTWNGNGNATIGHGLGVAPQLIICKKRSGVGGWQVGHSSIGWTRRLFLESTGTGDTAASAWNNTAPTSTVFTVGNTSLFGGDIVSYCFAPVAGYSSAGSYTGNGSADGPFVYTSMRPRWILLKRTDSTSNWTILDTAREGYNVDNDPLFPNLADAEGTADLADILSNGFKLRSTDASVNASGGTYIYYAIGENAFSLARAR